MKGAEIAQLARDQLAQLTGLEPETVSSLKKDDTGWRVEVDMIELQRIPASMDVLAAYEALLDDAGTLVSYERTRRYHRGQVTGEK